MIVIGGYNSSNTCNLARICADSCPTFHIADPAVPGLRLRDPPPAGRPEGGSDVRGLAAGMPVRVQIGLTSGASTPDNLVADAIPALAHFAESPQLIVESSRLDRCHNRAFRPL